MPRTDTTGASYTHNRCLVHIAYALDYATYAVDGASYASGIYGFIICTFLVSTGSQIFLAKMAIPEMQLREMVERADEWVPEVQALSSPMPLIRAEQWARTVQENMPCW